MTKKNAEMILSEDSNSPEQKDKMQIFHHYLEQLINGNYSDVEIIVGSNMIKGHKCFLARSSVFANFFKYDKTGSIEIHGFNYTTVYNMLIYLYTDKVPGLTQNVKEMLQIADMYDLDGLKSMCENRLIRNLTKENVFELLVLANKCNSHRLKTMAKALFLGHKEELIQSEGIKFFKEHASTNLACEILEDVISSPNAKKPKIN